MLPIQEALNRVVAILDRPDFHLKRQQIEEHLDTIIEYARDSDEGGSVQGPGFEPCRQRWSRLPRGRGGKSRCCT